ncbi:nucleotide pyrophosphohydrolase [candidate division TA06 bacterium]|nr:nucleotide pyrophosphohydrolase [candidate division TA06 bacterium]
MKLQEFQRRIEEIYGGRDRSRGVEGTFVRFSEEVGELARSIRKRDEENLKEEFADVCAWLFTLASLWDVDMEEAVRKYEKGCPRCGERKCRCPEP